MSLPKVTVWGRGHEVQGGKGDGSFTQSQETTAPRQGHNPFLGLSGSKGNAFGKTQSCASFCHTHGLTVVLSSLWY